MVRCTVRVSVSAVVAVLLTGLCFSAFPQFSTFNFAHASSTLPVGDAEYANGTLVSPHSLDVWYDWINVSGTQVVSYAHCVPSDFPYPHPIAYIIGQHLQLADGTEVFVASALDGMEVYRDLNGDGIPQANFTSGESEILYFMYSNMSDAATMTAIQKVTENDTAHYQWSFTYQNVYAYLQNASTHRGVDVRFKLDHLTLSYDFSVNGNISNLKTNFDIGEAKDIQVFNPDTVDYEDSTAFSFSELSLSLLYATATYASKPYSTSVNGQPYNSSTTQDSAVDAEIAQVAVGDAKAYDFLFGGNYTLFRGENNETHQANIETYQAKAEAAAISSLTTLVIYGPAIKSISFFADELNLTDLFGGSWPNINTDYNASSLVYRICFPTWDGMQIIHDPVFVGYVSSTTIPEFPTTAIGVVLVGVTVLALATVKVRKSFFAQKR